MALAVGILGGQPREMWRCGTLNNVVLLQLFEFSLCRRQFLAIQLRKFGSDGRPVCDDLVDDIMADRR